MQKPLGGGTMQKKIRLAMVLVGIVLFSALAGAAGQEKIEATIRDPLVYDSNSKVTPVGQIYVWISGYADQDNPGVLYNIYWGGGDSGDCELYVVKPTSDYVAETHKAWWEAQVKGTGWCPTLDVFSIYAQITWTPEGSAPTGNEPKTLNER